MTLFEFFTLLGGVGLFLYGMSLMSQGLKLAAGNKLRSILEHATANRFVAVAVGVLVTLLVQSSSATDMMVISFVNSGLMTLAQAIGVIMGANIGTTVTAQITAFNLSDYASPVPLCQEERYKIYGLHYPRIRNAVLRHFRDQVSHCPAVKERSVYFFPLDAGKPGDCGALRSPVHSAAAEFLVVGRHFPDLYSAGTYRL